ncbi:MAG: RidA family protein [bacterium]|nr:RidA family protein [bacterium]
MAVIEPDGWKLPRGYSNGMLAPEGGRILFVAGQIGWDENQRLVEGGFVAQFARALANVVAVVNAAGGEAANVGRLTIYVTDCSEYLAQIKDIGRAYRSLMGSHYPAMALVEVQALLEPGAMVEIEATAVVS